ncbi:GGDEF domain-containing protein [Oceanobacillus bengalensis]|uniref:GGDEF domain-containing protein n=1 Tax=Oceanobacillus bengalensis TaxID=1435466 RepID=A0A494Z061_9BACI|nr:GGDEF domain-containing protein [Oceanobacillus bengalensis]RKQ15827.1 GGDEF domain-containing protein [Oceanobacillus bengalensis]
MLRLKLYIFSLFIIAFAVALASGPIQIDIMLYVKTLTVYIIFTCLYSHLNTIYKSGNVNIEYGISYGLSFAMFTGPLGVFIYELITRFYTYFQRKYTNNADEDELLHSFYNSGAHALNHIIGFYLFQYFSPIVSQNGIGYWALIVIIVIFLNLLSDLYLSFFFYLVGDITSFKDVIEFINSRSFNDTLKKAVSNGLLFIFLLSQQWSVLIALFVLNYLVSRSFIIKSQNKQHKLERDRYEQMAYTDFLSKVHNRAYMNKIMDELNYSNEHVAIVVTDIDTFKRINDTYNHTVGDHVIQHFAGLLKNCLAEKDYLFRSGGEEFTMIFRSKSYKECLELTNQIREDVEKATVITEYQAKTINLSYTASFGLYYYKATKALNIKKAYTFADDLLLQAKGHGKNKIISKNGLAELPLSSVYGK